ncbi:MAG: ABC transporter substrate-binding protein [Microbacterium sp.]|uniref:ABC transporter substrate-binding protein n=1 Tax=Microbacterium sp. TaxID=51671 RepID=UPI0027238A4D|nr:ABC transporter substrate-binding protein [Microbacterium sp.]MDO8382592.1 ABC transporter substrate-binding protein [Microbacterium sp.]
MKRTHASILAITALAGIFLSGCATSAPGDESGAGAGDTGGELTSIKVGVIPFAELAPFYIAIEDGIFDEHGLVVEPTQASGGASLITSLASGELQFIYSNYVSMLQASSRGIPLEIVRENDRPGAQAIYVLPDSGITTPTDLAGKSIAVNSLGNIMELTSRAALEDAGVDLDTVTFVEIPPPNMTAALEQGQVDAAWLVEPFVTLASGSLGVTVAADVFGGDAADLPIAGWATTPQFASENAETVDAFIAALDEASAIAVDDPSRVAEIIPTYTEIPAEVAAKLAPIAFTPTSELADIAQVQDLMIRFGYYTEPVDIDELAPAR